MNRAILFAAGERPEMAAFEQRMPTPMAPLLDRPVVQHAIETLARIGIRQVDVVTSHLPEIIEALLGDGTRWGLTIRYHLARDAERPYRSLRVLNFEDGRPVLVAHADRLVSLDESITEIARDDAPVLLEAENGWTGWAIVPPEILRSAGIDGSESEFEDRLRSLPDAGSHTVKALFVRGYHELLAANLAALEKRFDGLLISGREVEPGIWLSRNVSLHPTAKLVGPAYICADCRIGAGAEIGPNSVLGPGCVIDAHATITDSVVLGGSYVGEGVELDHRIIDRNRVIDVHSATAVTVVDDFILGAIETVRPLETIRSVVTRLVCLFVLILASPILLATWIRRKARGADPVLRTTPVLRTPAPEDRGAWRIENVPSFGDLSESGRTSGPDFRDFVERFLPGLAAVALGRIDVVGGPLRTPQEVRELPEYWRAIHLRSKVGLITESYVLHGAGASRDDRYAAEAWYAVASNLGHDLRLVTKYLRKVAFGPRPYLEEEEVVQDGAGQLLDHADR